MGVKALTWCLILWTSILHPLVHITSVTEAAFGSFGPKSGVKVCGHTGSKAPGYTQVSSPFCVLTMPTPMRMPFFNGSESFLGFCHKALYFHTQVPLICKNQLMSHKCGFVWEGSHYPGWRALQCSGAPETPPQHCTYNTEPQPQTQTETTRHTSEHLRVTNDSNVKHSLPSSPCRLLGPGFA